MNPPFEELFDEAEEYVLGVLFDAWAEMLASDLTTFDKVNATPFSFFIDFFYKVKILLTLWLFVVILQQRIQCMFVT